MNFCLQKNEKNQYLKKRLALFFKQKIATFAQRKPK